MSIRADVSETRHIEFRPSPNFKNMKKFLKSKIDHMDSQLSLPSQDVDPQNDTNAGSLYAQPPLPLGPPPPPSISTKDQISVVALKNIKKEEEPAVTRPTACRDYIRGSCTRPGCKFAHEYDLSQLKGVYTFCHNYQNSVCTYPNCKFVHATIFEQEEFYRTGILPPHAIAHHKKKNTVKFLPPPPPPPPDNEEEAPPAYNIPALQQQSLVPVPFDLPPNLNFYLEYMNRSMEKKQESDGSFAGSSRANDRGNCKNCGVMENRLQHSNESVQKLKSSISDINNKMEQLQEKEKRLKTVLQYLVKNSENKKY